MTGTIKFKSETFADRRCERPGNEDTLTPSYTLQRCRLVQNRGGICMPVRTVCCGLCQRKEASAVLFSHQARNAA